jgi:hypothetical protein
MYVIPEEAILEDGKTFWGIWMNEKQTFLNREDTVYLHHV